MGNPLLYILLSLALMHNTSNLLITAPQCPVLDSDQIFLAPLHGCQERLGLFDEFVRRLSRRVPVDIVNSRNFELSSRNVRLPSRYFQWPSLSLQLSSGKIVCVLADEPVWSDAVAGFLLDFGGEITARQETGLRLLFVSTLNCFIRDLSDFSI